MHHERNGDNEIATTKPTRKVTIIRDGERYDLTVRNIDASRDGVVRIGLTHHDEVPDWMPVFSHGFQGIIYDDMYDEIVFSNFGTERRDELVTTSDEDAALPANPTEE